MRGAAGILPLMGAPPAGVAAVSRAGLDGLLGRSLESVHLVPRGSPVVPPGFQTETILMKSIGSRLSAVAVIAILSWVALAGATAPRGPALQPDKLVILSTTDVKGKTSPCG
jgi:hypothetical protein